jgi:hypothetical protein
MAERLESTHASVLNYCLQEIDVMGGKKPDWRGDIPR